jgi:hypothetical protein
MRDPELWTGVIELKPLGRKQYGAAGAFTNLVTWACDSEGFRRKAETIAATLGMYVAGVEKDGPLSPSPDDWSEELEDMVRRAESNPNAIVYGTFHRYPHDEA